MKFFGEERKMSQVEDTHSDHRAKFEHLNGKPVYYLLQILMCVVIIKFWGRRLTRVTRQTRAADRATF